MAEVVGTAYVRIRAITAKLAADIKDSIDKGAAEASPASEKAGREIGDSLGKGLKESVDKVLPDVGADAGEKLKVGIRDGIRAGGSNVLTDDDRDRLLGNKSGVFEKFSNALGSRLARVFHIGIRDGNDRESGRTTRSLSGTINKILSTASKLKIPAPIWIGYLGLPAIVGLAKTFLFYLGGIVARVGALTQAALGGGLAFAAMGLQAAAAGGLILAAFKTQTPQLERFQARMKEIGAGWKEVAIATQEPLLPNVGDAFQIISRKLIPVFKDLGREVGKTTGEAAELIATILTSDRAMRSWEVFSNTTKETTGYLGQAVANLSRGFMPLLEAAAPLGTKLAASINHLANRWADMLETAGQSGKLSETLNKWYDAAQNTASALGDLFVGLWNILRIGSDVSGLAALDRFDAWAENFRNWTASIEGESKIRKFFEEAEPVIREVNALVRDIFGYFFQSVDEGTGSKTIVGVLEKLRTETLPVIVDGIKQIVGSFNGSDGDNASKFVDVFTRLIEAFIKTEILIPTMEVVIKLLESLVTVLNTPIVGDIVGPILAIGAVAGFIKGPIAVLGTVLGGLGSALNWALGLFVPGGAGTLLSSFLAGLGGAGSAVEAGGLIGFFASLGGVIGTIAAPLAAIAGLFTVLYFLVDGVRKVFDDAWDAIQRVLDQFLKFDITDFSGNFKAATDMIWNVALLLPRATFAALWGMGEYIVKFFQNLPGWIGDAWGWLVETIGPALGAAWDAVWDFFEKLPGRIAGAVVSLGSAAWDWFTTSAAPALANAWTALWTWLTGLPGRIIGLVSGFWDWIGETASKIPYWLGYALGFIVGWAIRLPIELFQLLQSAATALFGWIIDALPGIIGWLGNVWTTIYGWVLNFVAQLPGWIWGAIQGITGWIIEAVPVLLGKLGEFLGWIWGWVSNFVAELPGRIFGAVAAILSWLVEAIPQLPGKLAEFGQGIFDWLKELPGKLVEAAGDVTRWLFDLGADVLRGLIDGVKGAIGSIGDVVGDIKDGFVDGIKGVFGIGSPAKKMMPLGRDIINGVIVGARGQSDQLQRELADMINLPSVTGQANLSVNAGPGTISPAAMQQLLELTSNPPKFDATIYVGDRELTDIIDVQVSRKNEATGRTIFAKGI